MATTHDVIVIGASAGGVEAISTVVAGLPRDLRAAVFIVLHLARGRSVLPDILTRVGRLPAVHPHDGDRIHYGRIYVGLPDHHLIIEEDVIRTTHGPTENGVRPAVDPLFRSAARAYGPRVIGVVLTGSLDDGTAGLAAVKEAGGIAIVQDPEDAFAPSMPRSAQQHVDVDHILPLRDIAPLLVSLTRAGADQAVPVRGPHLRPLEADSGKQPIAFTPKDRPGQLAVFTCPECHGNLWESEANGILRFRCRVGHVYTADSMLAAHTESVDRALWFALKALEERVALTRRLADRAHARQRPWVARAFEERAFAAEEHAAAVRDVLANRTAAQVVPDHTFDETAPEPAAVIKDGDD